MIDKPAIRLWFGTQGRPVIVREAIPERLVTSTVEAAVRIAERDASPDQVLSRLGSHLVREVLEEVDRIVG